MPSTRHSVLALLGLAISICAAPAGLRNRQIGISPPSQSVSWDTGDSEPTQGPSYSVSWDGPGPSEALVLLPEPDSPAPMRRDQTSLGTPSYWVSWDTGAVSPTPTPETPGYSPSKPCDQTSSDQPSSSASWGGTGPSASPTPKPKPKKSSATRKPSASKSTEAPGSPSWSPSPSIAKTTPAWTRKSSHEPTSPPKATPKPSSTPTPTPCPTPTPAPAQPSDQISLGTPTYSVSWAVEKRHHAHTSSNDIAISPPQASISWAQRAAEPQDATIGLGFPDFSVSWPEPTPQASVSWGKRDAEPQDDTVGLGVPGFSVSWPESTPQPPGYVSWGRREDAVPAAAPTPPAHVAR